MPVGPTNGVNFEPPIFSHTVVDEFSGKRSNSDSNESPPETTNGKDSSSLTLNEPPLTWEVISTLFHQWAVQFWEAMCIFFFQHQGTPEQEKNYIADRWYDRKSSTLVVAFWFILNWVLGLIFIQLNLSLLRIDQAFYYAWAPAFNVPLPFLIAFDWPKKRPVLYQTFLWISVFSWALYVILNMYLCDYFGDKEWIYNCSGKEFLGWFYYALALPVLALFCLNANRLSMTVGSIFIFVLSTSLLGRKRQTWVRLMINYIIFQIMIIWVHYQWERSDRALHKNRAGLKENFRAKLRAQESEKRAFENKKRLTSYVFHEVRVPLNSAWLAVQNIEHGWNASDSTMAGTPNTGPTLARESDEDFQALKSSLDTMGTILDDMLDYDRFESGRFACSIGPFQFHQALKNTIRPMKLSADDKGLDLTLELDENIDLVARRAVYQQKLVPDSEIASHLSQFPDVYGTVTGDTNRIGQILRNLVSNACKFTQAGGKVVVRTKLLAPTQEEMNRGVADAGSNQNKENHGSGGNLNTYPPIPGLSQDANVDESGGHAKSGLPLSTKHLEEHDRLTASATASNIIVRIEVEDTGCGIKPADLKRGRLFSDFIQTDRGKMQGGKGTGLGLALVKRIVTALGGRLGVTSQESIGSTFWVELPLGTGAAALAMPPSAEGDAVAEELNKAYRQSDANDIPRTLDFHASLVSKQMMDTDASRRQAVLNAIMDPCTLFLYLHSTLGPDPSTIALQPPPRVSSQSSPPNAESKVEGADGLNNDITMDVKTAHVTPLARPTYLPMPSTPSMILANLDQVTTVTEKDSPKAVTQPIEVDLPVLIVEDDPTNQRTLKRMLTKQFGCRVTTADNGLLGLQTILGHANRKPREPTFPRPIHNASPSTGTSTSSKPPEFALVLLDNQMPIKSGVDMVRELKEDWGRKDIFVVGCTGNATFEEKQEFKDAGADDVLAKPLRTENLGRVLATASKRWARRHSLSARSTTSPPGSPSRDVG
ncbi:hypothetical protein DL96DRAFT_1458885 [Flagelloscypha sp. PMI_526]|nr:hypothetical protein DL96DRAFT_1458885 [Flagelloscypha sp. PMI_526]